MSGRRAPALPAPRPEWAYFFDVDGTLVDIAEAPGGGAGPDGHIQRLIVDLYRATGGAVALISGRSLAQIDGLLPDVRLPAAGQHGVERRDATGRVHHAVPSPELETVRRGLTDAVDRHPGLQLEDKGLSLALHYRRAPRLAGYAHRLARSLVAGSGGAYGVQEGKRVVEIKPAGKDKGMAVLEFMQEEPFRGRTPVFVGDDSTDEHAFVTVNRLRGHSVKVGPGRTAARERLRDVRAVRAWLEQGAAAAAR